MYPEYIPNGIPTAPPPQQQQSQTPYNNYQSSGTSYTQQPMFPSGATVTTMGFVQPPQKNHNVLYPSSNSSSVGYSPQYQMPQQHQGNTYPSYPPPAYSNTYPSGPYHQSTLPPAPAYPGPGPYNPTGVIPVTVQSIQPPPPYPSGQPYQNQTAYPQALPPYTGSGHQYPQQQQHYGF